MQVKNLGRENQKDRTVPVDRGHIENTKRLWRAAGTNTHDNATAPRGNEIRRILEGMYRRCLP